MATESIFPTSGYSLVPGVAASAGMNKPEFDGLIDNYGERFTWERLVACPCSSNAETDQADPMCLHCYGNGWLYFEEGTPIRGVVMQPTFRNRDLNVEGVVQSGEVTITFRAETPVGYRHRVTMLDAVLEFSERTTRKASPQRLQFPVATRHLTYRRADTGEEIEFEYSVLRLVYRNAEKEIVDLVPDVDFQIDEDGLVDWTYGLAASRVPAVGTVIGVTYWCHPRYIITSMAPYPLQNVWTGENVPAPIRQSLPTSVKGELDFLRTDR